MSYIQGNVILYTKFVVVHLLSFNNDICLKFEIIELVIGTGRYMHALSAIGLSVMIYISTSLTIHLIILQLIQDCEMICTYFFMAHRPYDCFPTASNYVYNVPTCASMRCPSFPGVRSINGRGA